MSRNPIEIECPACASDSLLRREPVYEGFRQTGQKLCCAACGHEFEDEASVPFKTKKKPDVFGEADKPAPINLFNDADRPEAVRVFEPGENERLCRYCAYYAVNPFVQRCVRSRKEVEATDTCANFKPKQTT